MAEVKKERRAAPRKPKAAPPVERRAASRKPTATASTAPAAAPSTRVADDERQRLIAEAAYYRAQARGFAPGYELEDWVAAEQEVRQRIGERSA